MKSADLLSADALAILVLGALSAAGRLDGTHAVMAILAVLAGRLSPRPWPSSGAGASPMPPGAPAGAPGSPSTGGGPPSGVATLAAGAVGLLLFARDAIGPVAGAAGASSRHHGG